MKHGAYFCMIQHMKKMPDYKASLKILRKDQVIASLIKKHGAPDIASWHGNISVFESLLRSIVFQQLSGHAARAIHARLLALFPGKPSPAALLKIRAPKLRACGLSVQKVAYVRDLARRFIDGTVDEKKFAKMTSDEIIEHLVAVKGVGVWTAQMLLIFNQHRLDILPWGDLAIRKGFQKVYGLKKEPTKKEMEKIAAPWRAHASVASWYLWREMDTQKKETGA
jgi:DNA-3-methyladenine glycosylase II